MLSVTVLSLGSGTGTRNKEKCRPHQLSNCFLQLSWDSANKSGHAVSVVGRWGVVKRLFVSHGTLSVDSLMTDQLICRHQPPNGVPAFQRGREGNQGQAFSVFAPCLCNSIPWARWAGNIDITLSAPISAIAVLLSCALGGVFSFFSLCNPQLFLDCLAV